MRTSSIQGCALGALVLVAMNAHAERKIEESASADARGNVEINNVSGSVQVQGWDKAQVAVTGTTGNDVERVSVSGDPSHITVQVVTGHQNRLWGSEGSAHLVVHVPAKSSVSATVVSADFSVEGLLGDLKLQSVSGDVKGEVGGDLKAGSVSGNVHLTARSAKSIAVKSVSGDITLVGGSGESEVSSVSGTITIEQGSLTRAHFKSVSGDIVARLGMTHDAQIETQSVSGDIKMKLLAEPAADFDVQTVSGEIDNCFGPKPVQPRHGPGARLEFKNGDSEAHVQITTKSGDVSLCTERGAPTKPSA